MSEATCGKCGRTYAQHLRDQPKHIYQGFVWLPTSLDDDFDIYLAEQMEDPAFAAAYHAAAARVERERLR